MDAAEDAMWWYRALHARLLAGLRGVTGRVLDVGCGTGGLLRRLADARPDLAAFGIEWNPRAAARAAAKARAPVVAGSVHALPFPQGQFAAVVAADVLCHRAVAPAAALAEIRRVLRPGGVLLLNMPAYAWLLSAHDRRVHNARRQTAGQVGAMLEDAGFTGVRAAYWNGLALPLMVLRRKFLPRHNPASDVARFRPWLDATLHAVTELERALPFGLPAGGSVLASARRA